MPLIWSSNGDGPRGDRKIGQDLTPAPHAREAGQGRALVPGAVEEENGEGDGNEGLGRSALVLDEGLEPERGRCFSLVLLARAARLLNDEVGEDILQPLGGQPRERRCPMPGEAAGDE